MHNHGRPGPYTTQRPSSAHSVRRDHNYDYDSAGIPQESIYPDAEFLDEESLSLTRSPSASSSDASTDLLPGAPSFHPAEMQLVKYGARARSQSEEFRGREGGLLGGYPEEISIAGTEGLAGWSEAGTKGSETNDSLSVTSSQDIYSESDTSAGSLDTEGYAGSFDGRQAYKNYRDDVANDDFESDEEYMSDGIASDEGDYYWSDDERDSGDWEDSVYEEESIEESFDEEELGERFGRL